MQVSEIMTTDFEIENAVQLMQDKQVRRLIVCNANKEPVGVLSLGDVAAKTKQDELAGQALESISEPAVPTR